MKTGSIWITVYCSVTQLSEFCMPFKEDDNGEVVPASPHGCWWKGEKRTWHKGTEACPYFDANIWAYYHSLIWDLALLNLLMGLVTGWKKAKAEMKIASPMRQ